MDGKYPVSPIFFALSDSVDSDNGLALPAPAADGSSIDAAASSTACNVYIYLIYFLRYGYMHKLKKYKCTSEGNLRGNQDMSKPGMASRIARIGQPSHQAPFCSRYD